MLLDTHLPVLRRLLWQGRHCALSLRSPVWSPNYQSFSVVTRKIHVRTKNERHLSRTAQRLSRCLACVRRRQYRYSSVKTFSWPSDYILRQRTVVRAVLLPTKKQDVIFPETRHQWCHWGAIQGSVEESSLNELRTSDTMTSTLTWDWNSVTAIDSIYMLKYVHAVCRIKSMPVEDTFGFSMFASHSFWGHLSNQIFFYRQNWYEVYEEGNNILGFLHNSDPNYTDLLLDFLTPLPASSKNIGVRTRNLVTINQLYYYFITIESIPFYIRRREEGERQRHSKRWSTLLYKPEKTL